MEARERALALVVFGSIIFFGSLVGVILWAVGRNGASCGTPCPPIYEDPVLRYIWLPALGISSYMLRVGFRLKQRARVGFLGQLAEEAELEEAFQTLTCPKCFAENSADRRVCESCGTILV